MNDKFFMFAAKAYNNPCFCSIDDFKSDLKRIKYIKKLLNKYIETGEFKESLLLGHFVVLSNMFDSYSLAILIFNQLDVKYYSSVKTFLHFLSYVPINPLIYSIDGKFIININDIEIDPNLLYELEQI